ncbi:MAG: hypothetical protein ACRYGL_01040 [Janthinobacterium lividum]
MTLKRAASDDHPVVRRFLANLAGDLATGVNDAFAVCTPALTGPVVDFRRLTFFNALAEPFPVMQTHPGPSDQ